MRKDSPRGKNGTTTKDLGKAVEDEALRYLLRQGLSLVTKNFAGRRGEIDLILRDGLILVFVEVRYRKTTSFGSGAETVTYTKQQRLIQAAQEFLLKRKLGESVACRFDVISATGPALGKGEPQLTWIKNAFAV